MNKGFFAGRDRCQEFAGFDGLDGDLDADLGQLRLEFLGYLAGQRQVDAHDIAIGQGYFEPIRETGFGQERLGSRRIVVVPLVAIDIAGHHRRAGRTARPAIEPAG